MFLAAFQAILARHSGQDDVVVATVVSIRQPRETEDMLGSFANLLLLRTKLGGTATFRELIQRARETVTGALAHQDLPFELLAREFGGDSTEGTLPDTSAVLIFHGVDPLHRFVLPGLTVTPVPLDTGWTKPELQLTICDQGDHFAGGLQYSVDRFEASTIDSLLAEFQELLRTVTTAPEARILGPGGISARAPAASSVMSDAPEATRHGSTGLVQPTAVGPLEEIIARAFRDVLRCDQVAADDNFFELGARSIQLVQVSGQLTRLPGREVSVLSMLEFPTIRVLAQHLSGARGRDRSRVSPRGPSALPPDADTDVEGQGQLDRAAST